MRSIQSPALLSRIFVSRVFPALSSAALLIGSVASNARAQTMVMMPSVHSTAHGNEAMLVLPDSPGTLLAAESFVPSSSSVSLNLSAPNLTAPDLSALDLTAADISVAAFDPTPAGAPHTASHSDKYIAPGELAPSITTSDKYLLGTKQIVTPLAVAGWLSAAGYSQLIDNAPNYGTDRGAFGQRLGAAAIRGTTEGFLSDAVMASIFRQDPRYYMLGRGHGFFNRVVYAASRTLITRTDSGRSAPNYALITGNIEGSILTNAYYPERNRDVTTTFYTFAGSIGGSALGFVVSEFFTDTMEILHFKKSR